MAWPVRPVASLLIFLLRSLWRGTRREYNACYLAFQVHGVEFVGLV